MPIIIDVTRLTRRILKKQTLTGIDRVSIAYVKHYQTHAQALFRLAGFNIILSANCSQRFFSSLLNHNYKIPLKTILLRNLFKKNIIKNSILLNTGHIGINQKNYIKMIIKYNLKPIFFVHDLIPIEYPEYCCKDEDLRHKEKLNYILKYGCGVITNTQDTLDRFNRFCETTNQTKLPAVVGLLAPDIKLHALNSSFAKLCSKPYFVMVSTIEPRKNHLLILQIFRRLAEIYPDNSPHLFIIGKRGWECEQVLDLLDRCHTLKKVVTEVSNCQDKQLINYIKNSQALLFPSFTEGYGLPLIESLALGTPVIASDLNVFKEIAFDIPEYIDPLDSNTWQSTILDYANPNSLKRNNQMKRLQNFHIPTWQEHFQKIDEFLTKEI